MFRTVLISGLLFLVFTTPVLAARSLVISNDKSTLTGDELLTITASPSGFLSNEQIYVKGAFFKDGSTNYFGYTQKGNDWIKNNENYADQLPVQIGSWDGILHIKPDFGDTGFTGSGDYKLRVGYYYSGNNWSPVQWSDNTVVINLVQPTSAPTNTPTPTPLPTSAPTGTPGPTAVPTKTPTPKPTPVPTAGSMQTSMGEQEFVNGQQNAQGQLLNLDDSSPPPTPAVLGESIQNTNSWVAYVVIGLGIVGLLVSLLLLFLHARKESGNSDFS